jgi:hypothetical protein
VNISLKDGLLQIEGSEAFVSEQLAKLEPHIVKAFENGESVTHGKKSKLGAKTSDSVAFSEYEHLFAEVDGNVQILKAIPGKNNAQKTVNIALLQAFAKFLMGAESVSSTVVRDVCKAHACLDSGNFASTIKSENSLFILTGTGNSKDIKLTVPGRSKAEELAKQLNIA